MAAKRSHPVLAQAAGVLSEQLQQHLTALAALLQPVAGRLDRQFRRRLRPLKLDPRCIRALSAITPCSICRLLAGTASLDRVFEEIDYQGRRLAKLDLRPQEVLAALLEYDKGLAPVLRRLAPGRQANFQWVQEQLHFCTVLILNQSYYQVRETESGTFYELARREVQSRGLDDLLQGAAETLANYAGADAVQIFLRTPRGEGWQLRAAVPREDPCIGAVLTECTRESASDAGTPVDPTWQGRFRRIWNVPLSDGVHVSGIMQFAFTGEYPWLPRERELLEGAAERCLFAVQRAQMLEDLAAQRDQIQQLAERMLQVEEAERRRISRELHDEAGQSLLCIRLQLEMLEHSLPDARGEDKAKLREIRELAERTIIEMRRLIAALSPAVLEQLGFEPAVRQLATRLHRLHSCRVKLRIARLPGVPKEMTNVAYRLLQECCNNITKHSGAKNVILSVETADGRLRLQVEDDGVGFDVQEAFTRQGVHGLAGIRERVAVLGGDCSITSVRAGNYKGDRPGTTLRIQLPLSKADRDSSAAG